MAAATSSILATGGGNISLGASGGSRAAKSALLLRGAIFPEKEEGRSTRPNCATASLQQNATEVKVVGHKCWKVHKMWETPNERIANLRCALHEASYLGYVEHTFSLRCDVSKYRVAVQRGVNLFELSWEKVSARLQPATAGHARLVLRKQLEQIYTSL